MKISDYIVQFLEAQGITDIFGLPGVGCGHFMNSLIGSSVRSHLVYHEQAAAFAACGYAQAARRTGFAYTTAGPGGTNLLTGIANAYADSIPTVFMVGEKDLSSLRGELPLRQKASQEVDIVSMAAPVTKWSYQVRKSEEIRYVMERAFYIASSGRPGPVLLDIPSDIARDEVEVVELEGFTPPERIVPDLTPLMAAFSTSKKPLLLIGGGVKQVGLENELLAISERLNLPIVTSLTAFDLLSGEPNLLGFIGVDGDIAANRAVAECDVVLSLGARLNFKQVGADREKFAPNASLIRVDVDPGELEYHLRDEVPMCFDLRDVVPALTTFAAELEPFNVAWLEECVAWKAERRKTSPSNLIGASFTAELFGLLPKDAAIVVDTGSHRRWVIAEHHFKPNQRLYQSAGLASMGYALPAAIGVAYGQHVPVICIDGDGGLMMNLQELQQLRRDQLPITVVVMNNRCYGDIMEFQKSIFKRNYFATTETSGYFSADFKGLAAAFHLDYTKVTFPEELSRIDFSDARPKLVEVAIPDNA